MPDTIRSSGCYARPWLRRILAGHWTFAGIVAWRQRRLGPSQPPKLVLHEFVQGATRSIDRHEVAAIVLFAGLLLFAVVTAILLLRTRGRLVRLEASAHDEIAALRSDLDRANALLLSEPQVMVDWPAASDEPTIEGDPALVGAAAAHRVLAFGSWLDPQRAAAHGAGGRSVAHPRRGLFDGLHHARRPSDRGAGPRHRRARRAAPQGCERRQARAARARRPARETAQRGRFAARLDRAAAVAGLGARRRPGS